MSNNCTNRLRDLAYRVAEVAHADKNQEVRQLWSDHNALKKVRPPVYVRLNCWSELIPESDFIYKDGILRDMEFYLRTTLYNTTLGFDLVVDPFVTVPAVYAGPPVDRLWGLTIRHRRPDEARGAWGFEPPLKEYDDLEKLRRPRYAIDHLRTNQQAQLVREALGDSLAVRIDYGGPLGISASLGYIATALRGFQSFMADLLDNPAWVHRLMRFLSEAHLDYLRDMEQQNGVTANHVRWPFYHPLLNADYDPAHVRLIDCWGYGESQEFDLLSPAMLDEFLLAYQIPIFRLTGLNHYGCCENLTHKYPLLTKIPGLRRVSVSPWTDFAKAVEIMGDRCALNWRYPPAEVTFNFDENRIKTLIQRNLELARQVPVEIVLQDIETANGHPEHLHRWVQLAKEAACE